MQTRCVALGVLLVALPAGAGSAEPRNEKIVQAYRITEPIVVDGRLSESAWTLAEPATNFTQQWPKPGAPASERTEVRILYDDENLYIGAFCFDSAGPRGIIVNDQRRDFDFDQNDVLTTVLDTYHDHRNAFMFITNPVGGRLDAQVGESYFNTDWDGLWYNKSAITEEGWQSEIAIPFKTLRFQDGVDRVWGINFLRRVRRKGEDSYWSPVPRPYRMVRVSLAGSLMGLAGLRPGRNLRFKPYVTALGARIESAPTKFDRDAGLDIKYGLRSQLTLDVTTNTDFSHVEADVQQINLTRFSLFFPEKREFFLENASIFQFGTAPRGQFVGSNVRGTDLIPFFSRNVGLSGGKIVPILGGARLSGRAGRYTTGVMTMQTDDLGTIPSTNFSVVRLRRDVLRRSDIGAIFVSKAGGGHSNRTYGVDANFGLGPSLDVSSYILKTETPDLRRDDTAGNFRVAWRDTRIDAIASYLTIGDDFEPEVGFVPRRGMRKGSAQFTVTPRGGRRMPSVREFRPTIETDYITGHDGRLQTRRIDPSLTVTFQKGSSIEFGHETSFERLDVPFPIHRTQRIPAGDYRFGNYYATYTSDRSRALSGIISANKGSFYVGDRTSYSMTLALKPGYRFRMETTWSRNDIALPSGSFVTDLVSARIGYSFSNTLFLNGLLQYNSDTGEISSNVRFNMIYRPLSDIFIVYNERQTRDGRVLERALIAKLTYLLAF